MKVFPEYSTFAFRSAGTPESRPGGRCRLKVIPISRHEVSSRGLSGTPG